MDLGSRRHCGLVDVGYSEMKFTKEKHVRQWVKDHAQGSVFWIEQGNTGATVGFPDCLVVDWNHRLVPVELKCIDADEVPFGVFGMLRPSQKMCHRQLHKNRVQSWVLVGCGSELWLGRPLIVGEEVNDVEQRIFDWKRLMELISADARIVFRVPVHHTTESSEKG